LICIASQFLLPPTPVSIPIAIELQKAKLEQGVDPIPPATRCLEKALNSALTFFKFPAEDWLSIRTTNIIERLNKEFKRRTKVMEIVASEKALYNLLAFICLKMEIYWRRSPMGRVVSAMFIPQLKAASDFTQNA
jgi:putative transposase